MPVICQWNRKSVFCLVMLLLPLHSPGACRLGSVLLPHRTQALYLLRTGTTSTSLMILSLRPRHTQARAGTG